MPPEDITTTTTTSNNIPMICYNCLVEYLELIDYGKYLQRFLEYGHVRENREQHNERQLIQCEECEGQMFLTWLFSHKDETLGRKNFFHDAK